jgi:soluble lytic murein transglycosylase-like protein
MSYRFTMGIRLLLWIVVVFLVWASVAVTAADIPGEAAKHRREIIRNARLVWGLDAPVSVFAAQIQQESGFNPNAVSRVGASGLAQFMPATAEWIAVAYPELGLRQPLNPAWAIRAMVTYDRHLYDRVTGFDNCHAMAKMLSGYNGGPGWVERDELKAAEAGLDWTKWWGVVEGFNAGRSPSNWVENRGYPRRILKMIAPRYKAAGWGATPC